MSASAILKKAFPLIPTHGFTRACIAEASALSDTAITALFGRDSEAERVLVDEWLKEGVKSISSGPGGPPAGTQPAAAAAPPPTLLHTQLKASLGRRLKYNEPVLKHLPDAYAVLGTQTAVIPFDPRPAFEHAFRIADEALHVSGDTSLGPQWYARRAAIAMAYSAAELHQIQSPDTASGFLSRLLDDAKELEVAVGSVGEFAGFAFSGWKGILKAQGVLP
ncbi:hypothetical protein FRB90_001641 [Tulasnella sp. 427]|nr:hypothetical protein FRB90_001641 [Tulasnella sp. 427]